MAKKKKRLPTRGKTTVPLNTKSSNSLSFQELLNGVDQNKLHISVNTFYTIYRRNADVRAGVREIAKRVGLKGLSLKRLDEEALTDSEKILEKAILKIIRQPTVLHFKTNVFKSSIVSGELYIKPNFDGLGMLEEFQVLDPRSMSKMITEEGEIRKYVQYGKRGTRKTYEPEEIAYFQFEADHDNEANGLSLLEGVVWETLGDIESSKTQYYFYENDSVPRAIYILNSDFDYSDEKTLAALDALEDDMKGAKNKGKSITSNLIQDVKPISISAKDMDTIASRKLTTDKVCAILGVNKSILGYTENVNYANGREQKAEYIEGTVVPYEEFLEHVLNSCFEMFTNDFDPETYTVNVQSENPYNVFDVQKSQREDVKDGILTVNEVREERGLDPIEEVAVPAEKKLSKKKDISVDARARGETCPGCDHDYCPDCGCM